LVAWGGILVLAYTRLRQAQRLFAGAKNHRMAELAAALQIGFAGYLVSAIFFHGSYPRYLWLQIATAVALAVTAKRYAAVHAPELLEQPADKQAAAYSAT
jgi:hypothetical protein